MKLNKSKLKKILSIIIVVLAIAGPYLKRQWPMIHRRLTHGSAGTAKGGR
ncbi:MAG: hypothetical protein J6B40_04050 [Oscillospiraceae bacterium]|nr:hypothetical protein [Oscillospiraceae bacterium]